MPLAESDSREPEITLPGNGMDYPIRHQHICGKDPDPIYVFHAGFILSDNKLLRRVGSESLSGGQNGRMCNCTSKEIVSPVANFSSSDFIAGGEHGHIGEIVHVRRSIGSNEMLEEFEVNCASGAANIEQFPKG